MTDALGGTSTIAYDAAGNLIAQTDELNRTSLFTYDSRNWLIAITDPLNHQSTRTYDAVGNILTTADALGHTTRYGYDALDRQVSTTDAVGQTTSMTYDRVGNLLSLTDPDLNRTRYTYDALDRQLTDTNQLGLSRTYAYDAVGNETSMVDRNGRKTIYGYDALNRQTQEVWLDAAGNPIHITDRSYDAASQLTAIGDPDSRYAYSYDLAGRLTSVDNAGTPGVPTVVLGYSYDVVNNKLSRTDAIDGQLKGTEAYSYDALDRLTRVTQSGNGVSEKRVDLTYDAASQIAGMARYADLLSSQSVANSEYSFDWDGRLTRLTHQRGTKIYADYQWSYDAASRITRFVSPDGTSDYNYDDHDQLTSTDHSYQSDEAYSYDANGNRTNAGYQTGLDNRLLSDGSYSYTYDNEGNRISRTSISTGEVTSYSWDYHNRLTAVVTKDSSGAITKSVAYSYDVYDRRIAKTVDGPATPVTERMVYDGDNITLTFDGQGNQTHRYLYGPGVDQILADETATGEVLWALTDNQGTVRDVVDSHGDRINHISYDSFGRVTSQTNPSAYFRFAYTGREVDNETGLMYYRARYYDASTGRFISQDPIGFGAEDSNLYRYVSNSPLNFIDPFGLTGTALDPGRVASSGAQTFFTGAVVVVGTGFIAATAPASVPVLVTGGIILFGANAIYSAYNRTNQAICSQNGNVGQLLGAIGLDSVGLSGLAEGATGRELVSGRVLGTNERSDRLGQSLGNLATGVVGNKLFNAGSNLGNALSKTLGPKNITLDLFGGRTSQVPGAINVDIIAEQGIRANILTEGLSSIPSNSIDRVTTFNPFIPEGIHRNMLDFLPEAARVTKPGGQIIVSGTSNNRFAQIDRISPEVLNDLNLNIVQKNIPIPQEFTNFKFFTKNGDLINNDRIVTTILEKRQ